MLKNIRLKVFTLILLSLFCFVQAVIADSLKVKVSKGGGNGEIRFEVPAPINYVREIISNDQLFMPLIPGIQKWKILEEAGNFQIAECTMVISSIIKPATYKVRLNQPSKDEIKFKRISGDLKDLEGSWKIKSNNKENITQITYAYRVDTGMTLIPKVIIEKELKKHLEETKRRVTSKVFQMYKNQIPKTN